jgi:hypothetical protein
VIGGMDGSRASGTRRVGSCWIGVASITGLEVCDEEVRIRWSSYKSSWLGKYGACQWAQTRL